MHPWQIDEFGGKLDKLTTAFERVAEALERIARQLEPSSFGEAVPYVRTQSPMNPSIKIGPSEVSGEGTSDETTADQARNTGSDRGA